MASSLSLSLPFPFHHKTAASPFNRSSLTLPFSTTSLICFSSQTPSAYDREESRWLREEQRWLQEESRWLREEQRWIRERESLLREISDLRLRIQALESRIPASKGVSAAETISSIGALLQVLKEKNRIAESGSSVTPMVLEEEEEVEEEVKEKRIIAETEVRISKSVKEEKKRITLRMGSEGEEVREMQEALLKLGFYSGEEDMEYSSFSSGTERAVKTWQASLGVLEDGIMTMELLERLYMDQMIDRISPDRNTNKEEAQTAVKQEEDANGAAVASVTQISEMRQTVMKDEGGSEVEVSQQRVFLLGENRWEDPSRLIGRNKPDAGEKSIKTTTKCLTCRGEGRLMCTECDGSGEPNVEPQFLEWVEEGAKCPYCGGLGYTICDLCEGILIS